MKPLATAFLMFFGLAGSALAQTAAPCADPVHHEFDFWIGDWQVSAGGKQVGTNRVDAMLDGCALLENWVGASGVRGHSLNFYDAARGGWHQTWVDSTGTSLLLDGQFKDGHMALSSEKRGQRVADRITWTPNADGTVHQYWEHTDDGGKSWSVAFDGLYRRTGLAGTSWRLLYFQSSDDSIGKIVPPNVANYTLEFRGDHTLAMRLDCNRANAKWEATPSSSGGGSLAISPAAMTRAMCVNGAMDTRLARDLGMVRSYSLRDGRLGLALEADAGIYLWEPIGH